MQRRDLSLCLCEAVLTASGGRGDREVADNGGRQEGEAAMETARDSARRRRTR